MSSHWPYHRPPVKERLKKSLLIALTKRAIHHDSPVTRTMPFGIRVLCFGNMQSAAV